ncbi:MAG: MOSC domain-containing protein [Desulfovibrionaceae bacterium]|nr:MOSC domain-containing protein [Desulfovibrionaceae bacterium]
MEIVAVSTSKRKGEKKVNQASALLKANYGIEGDVHADGTHRQLSLLALESIESMRKLGCDVNPGDFAENLTTRGLTLHTLPVGTHLLIGDNIELEVTQIGKECHAGCAIAKQVGSCVMPKEGIFCRILQGGVVKPGDSLRVKSAL